MFFLQHLNIPVLFICRRVVVSIEMSKLYKCHGSLALSIRHGDHYSSFIYIKSSSHSSEENEHSYECFLHTSKENEHSTRSSRHTLEENEDSPESCRHT